MKNGKNCEGYSDPTATEAINHITKEERKVKRLIHVIREICDLVGYQVVGRIELENKYSGRRFK